MSQTIPQFLDTFNTLTKQPQKFLSVQSDILKDVKSLVKNIYDYTKTNEKNEIKGNALPELIVENFDDEQIWQELELQNEDCNNSFIPNISQLLAKKDRLMFPNRLKDDNVSESEEQKVNLSENDEEKSESGSDLENELELTDGEEEDYDEEDEVNSSFLKKNEKSAKSKPSVVDDKFFKLSEMEQFLEMEEKNEGKPNKSNELINYFEDIEIPSAEQDMYYNDFFEAVGDENEEHDLENDELGEDEIEDKSEDSEFDEEEGEKDSKDFRKQVRFNLSDDDNDNEIEEEIKINKINNDNINDSKTKSTLELRQERLDKLISKLEEEAISEKPWQLKGEVTAGARPPNSLLEEVVDFDVTARPAPIITEETTLRLEDIILRRIKDKSWDDVERKVKPVDTPAEFKKKLVLDQEKSKLSLSQIYEQEFIKQRDATKQQGDDNEEQEVEPPLHNEVRSMLTSLCNKLDALSNYHYTPRPAVPELKIITNERAITMEEVAPVTSTDASLLAPEEVQAKQKGDLIGNEERSATDKKRARRIKKQRQKFKAQIQKTVAKLNPGLGNKYSKQKAEQELKKVLNEKNVSKMEENSSKAVRSSTTFFRNLQDEVSRSIKSTTQPVKRKKNVTQMNAKKLKL